MVIVGIVAQVYLSPQPRYGFGYTLVHILGISTVGIGLRYLLWAVRPTPKV